MDYMVIKSLHLVGIVTMIVRFTVLITGSLFVELRKFRQVGLVAFVLSWAGVLGSAIVLVDALGLNADFPMWAKIKFYSFLVLGAWVFIIKKIPKFASMHYVTVLTICSVATILAVLKPTF